MSQFNITQATHDYAMLHCTPQYSPTVYGQIRYAISRLPKNATSAEGIICVRPIKLTIDADCEFMVSGGWHSITKREEEQPLFTYYTFCEEIRSNNAAILSGAPSMNALPTANATLSPSPTSISPTNAAASSQNAAVTVYPNFALSFFTLLFFMFVLFRPKH